MTRAVTVVSRKGCRLCEKVAGTLDSLSQRFDLEVRVLDIDDDPKLHEKYWLTIPAVIIDGRDVFDARHMGGELNYAIILERLLMAYDSSAVSA
jgi:glutaredoxin